MAFIGGEEIYIQQAHRENDPLQSRGGDSGSQKNPLFDYASSLFQMDVGTVYREPREFLSPWPNPDILVLKLLRDTHLGGGLPFYS